MDRRRMMDSIGRVLKCPPPPIPSPTTTITTTTPLDKPCGHSFFSISFCVHTKFEKGYVGTLLKWTDHSWERQNADAAILVVNVRQAGSWAGEQADKRENRPPVLLSLTQHVSCSPNMCPAHPTILSRITKNEQQESGSGGSPWSPSLCHPVNERRLASMKWLAPGGPLEATGAILVGI